MNENELLEAVREAMQVGPGEVVDGFTAQELASKLGCGEQRARRAIKHMIGNGTVEVVSVTRLRMGSFPARTMGYRIKS